MATGTLPADQRGNVEQFIVEWLTEHRLPGAAVAILALLQDEDPRAVVPHYRLVDTLDRACGDYVAYPDIADITVERDGGTLDLRKDYGFGGESMMLVPGRITEDELLCTTVTVDGRTHEARFVFGDDEVVLFEDRNRYTKPA